MDSSSANAKEHLSNPLGAKKRIVNSLAVLDLHLDLQILKTFQPRGILLP